MWQLYYAFLAPSGSDWKNLRPLLVPSPAKNGTHFICSSTHATLFRVRLIKYLNREMYVRMYILLLKSLIYSCYPTSYVTVVHNSSYSELHTSDMRKVDEHILRYRMFG